ncbi:MAG TPA: TfoX/Sxy family protein [Polyangiaceae bacterium]|jgi:TfoX/Sxy family transcriptional regulator of competence genes
MPYDEALADKVRRALAGTQGLTEKKMFGGIAFMVKGAMRVGVDKTDLIIRCEKDETDQLLQKKGVRVFDLSGGRPMKGWLLIGTEATKTPADFKSWIDFAQAGTAKGAKPVKHAKKSTAAKK